MLINLLEIISSKTIPTYNKKPKIRAQQLENCSWALKFLKEENIKLVAIGPEDLVDCRKKLILGLVWTIILRYHIQKGGASSSAKNDLLAWVQKQIPECNVKDFTDSWQDGKAICHLTDSLKRGAIDLSKVDTNPNALENATLGEDVAQAELDIPKILQPSDMVSPDSDELSVMTYISYFRDYANNEAKRNERGLKEKTADPARCVAHGPGLESGEQFVPGTFTITAKNCFGDNLKAGGDVFEVALAPLPASGAKTTSSGSFAPDSVHDNGDGTYTVHYTPLDYGKHTVAVTLRKTPIANSPYTVPVDRSSITVTGPGLESAELFVPSHFVIAAKRMWEAKAGASPGDFQVTLQGPKAPLAPPHVVDNGDGTYTVTYTAHEVGRHTINTGLKGRPIGTPPYLVAAKSGIHANTGASGDKAEQFIPTSFTLPVGPLREAGVELSPKDVQVSITPPTTSAVEAPVVQDDGHGNFVVTWVPLDVGKHVVLVNVKGQPIGNSPFNTPVDKSSITATGTGLERAEVLVPAHFTVDHHVLRDHGVNAAPSDFSVQITGPEGAVEPHVTHHPETGRLDVAYTPMTWDATRSASGSTGDQSPTARTRSPRTSPPSPPRVPDWTRESNTFLPLSPFPRKNLPTRACRCTRTISR
eukprot:TRINITY_DN4471_c0_g1_i2.p1 TRINITY_DN4471_c0_g1~~TRINITY_DN4471_c0_g1_i2.p1  ORF type:complete len:645 (+),score=123.57 TRINITY_DN4471_c0_g1_i2:75-2009(+)